MEVGARAAGREAKGTGDNLKLPEASGTLVTSTENGPITDDAFDRGRVFNYAPQERGNSLGQGSSLMDRPARKGGGRKVAIQLPYTVCTHV